MIEAADWSDLTPRLLVWTSFRLSKYKRTAGRFGTEPHQFVTRAVSDLLEERYEPTIIRSLFQVLAARIAALVHLDAEGRKW